MLTREDMSEVAVINIRVDRMAQRLRGRNPLIGEALLDAGDALAEAGSLMEAVLDDLTACVDCGMTVEDGECVCDPDAPR